MTTLHPTDSFSALPFSPWLLEAFSQLIVERTGIDVSAQDNVAVCKSILFRTHALNQQFPETYYQLLTEQTPQSHQEWQHLSELLTNSESFFFRDTGQISALRQHILPEIIEQHTTDKTIRICSAGCAKGEEPHSLAILLCELIPDIETWDICVYGVDLNPASVAHAREGIYSEWSLRTVDPALRQAYFRQEGEQYHVEPKFKKLVKCYPLNLVSDPFFLEEDEQLAELDLIICRNVFIYFESGAIAKVLKKFYQALSPLGYLLTGHSELYGQNLDPFTIKTLPQSLVFQRPEIATAVYPKSGNLLPASGLASSVSPSAQLSTLPGKSPPLSKAAIAGKYLKQAESHLQQKDFTLALQQGGQALKAQPKNLKALCLMAEAHAALNQPQQAIPYCNKAIKTDSYFIAPYYVLAKIFAAQGDLSAAKRTLNKVIYLDPTAVVAYLELSQLYQQEGNHRRSELMRQSAFDIFSQHTPDSVADSVADSTSSHP